ncbi:MAG: hypothetical protein AAF467_02855 [Actinomycetota bacterium]
MGRRIEVELTSTREDGSWTWRAAGARQPKGDLAGHLLYDGAKVGDVIKVEAEFHVDGIEVVEVFAPKQKKERSGLLEMKTRQFSDDELVTTQRASRDDRRGGRGGRGGNRRDRDDRRRGRGSGEDRRERRPQREPESRPKPKRLRPRRVHRDALLAEVGDEHRPIVEQVIKDGMPGVRAAIERQNAEAKEAGKPEIDAGPILAIAEKNLTKARLAEWRDRADAALADATELDLRDLRSVVVSGNDIARDKESREVAEQLKTKLDERVEADHNQWLSDLESAVQDGRVVRALRLSSRPVKAGAPLPPELASTLANQASEALASDVGQERWATVLDALAYSPVRAAVTPAGTPTEPNTDLIDAVKRLADRIPAIAALFGIDPASVPRSAKRRRPPRRDGGKGKGQGGQSENRRGDRPAPGAQPAPESSNGHSDPAAEATAADAPTAQEPAAEATEADAPKAEEAASAPVAEAPATDDAAPAAETGSSAEAEAPDTDAPEAEEAAPVAEEVAPEAEAGAPDDAATPAEAEAETAEVEDAPAGAEAPAANESAVADEPAGAEGGDATAEAVVEDEKADVAG